MRETWYRPLPRPVRPQHLLFAPPQPPVVLCCYDFTPEKTRIRVWVTAGWILAPLVPRRVGGSSSTIPTTPSLFLFSHKGASLPAVQIPPPLCTHLLQAASLRSLSVLPMSGCFLSLSSGAELLKSSQPRSFTTTSFHISCCCFSLWMYPFWKAFEVNTCI